MNRLARFARGGGYTTILEPQAVSDFVAQLVYGWRPGYAIDRLTNENIASEGLLQKPRVPHMPPTSMLGERIIDARISVSVDPMDPALGFPPFGQGNGSDDPFETEVYHATWIDRGVLTNFAYDRSYAIERLGKDLGLPNAGACRISVDGPTTAVEEMIATTKRGVLVTRFTLVQPLSRKSLQMTGYTRPAMKIRDFSFTALTDAI